jgi:hypothetical protein
MRCRFWVNLFWSRTPELEDAEGLTIEELTSLLAEVGARVGLLSADNIKLLFFIL